MAGNGEVYMRSASGRDEVFQMPSRTPCSLVSLAPRSCRVYHPTVLPSTGRQMNFSISCPMLAVNPLFSDSVT